MTDEIKKAEATAYLPEFEHFRPMAELGGKYGITTDVIAKAIGGSKHRSIRQGLIARIRDSDFYEANLKECVEAKDSGGNPINIIVRKQVGTKKKIIGGKEVEVGGHAAAFLTKEPAIILVKKYNTQGENVGKNTLFAQYLSDDNAFKEYEERRLKKEQEIVEAKDKEKELAEVVPPNEEETPDQPAVITELKEKIDALKVIAKNADLLTVRVATLERELKAQKSLYGAITAPMSKEQEEFVRLKLNNTAHHVATTIGCRLSGENPYAPVRERILEYVSSYLFTPCTQFGWQRLTKLQASMMLVLLRQFEEKGMFGSEEENEEMRDAVAAQIKRKEALAAAAFQDTPKARGVAYHS